MMLTGSWSFSQLSSAINHEDLPCGVASISYHPGINAIVYLLDDQKTWVFKADRSLAVGADICDSNFLDPTHTIGQYSVDLATLIQTKFSFKVRTFMPNPVFLNNEMYVIAYGYQTTLGVNTY